MFPHFGLSDTLKITCKGEALDHSDIDIQTQNIGNFIIKYSWYSRWTKVFVNKIWNICSYITEKVKACVPQNVGQPSNWIWPIYKVMYEVF